MTYFVGAFKSLFFLVCNANWVANNIGQILGAAFGAWLGFTLGGRQVKQQKEQEKREHFEKQLKHIGYFYSDAESNMKFLETAVKTILRDMRKPAFKGKLYKLVLVQSILQSFYKHQSYFEDEREITNFVEALKANAEYFDSRIEDVNEFLVMFEKSDSEKVLERERLLESLVTRLQMIRYSLKRIVELKPKGVETDMDKMLKIDDNMMKRPKWFYRLKVKYMKWRGDKIIGGE
jgi:hypothetical protein